MHLSISTQSRCEQAYKIEKFLGQGAFGEVYMATHNETGKKVAIKKIIVNLAENKVHRHLLLIAREIYILKKLSSMRGNSFTPQLLDAFVNDEAIEDPQNLTSVFMVVPYEVGNLAQVVNKNGVLDFDQFRILTFNILEAINYVHETGTIHRDLKPDNILIN